MKKETKEALDALTKDVDSDTKKRIRKQAKEWLEKRGHKRDTR